MRPHYTFLTALIFLWPGALLQAQADTLKWSRFEAAFTPNGGIFQNEYQSGMAHAVKTAGDKGAFFASALWLIQSHPQYGRSVSAHTYFKPKDTISSLSDSDYAAGPIADSLRYGDPAYEQSYERVWLISDSLVAAHRNNYQNPGYIVPPKIAEWPAHGDTSRGEAFIWPPLQISMATGGISLARENFLRYGGMKRFS